MGKYQVQTGTLVITCQKMKNYKPLPTFINLYGERRRIGFNHHGQPTTREITTTDPTPYTMVPRQRPASPPPASSTSDDSEEEVVDFINRGQKQQNDWTTASDQNRRSRRRRRRETTPLPPTQPLFKYKHEGIIPWRPPRRCHAMPPSRLIWIRQNGNEHKGTARKPITKYGAMIEDQPKQSNKRHSKTLHPLKT